MPHALHRSLAAFRAAPRDAGFQRVLARLAQTGMMTGAGLGLTAVVLFVGIHAVGFGKPLSWTYAEGMIALGDKMVLAGLCMVAFILAHHVNLQGARLLVAALIVVGAIASVTDDVVARDTSFSPGYLTFMYLLAVVAIPFHPLQTLGLGTMLSGAFYLCVETLPALLGQPPMAQVYGHYIYLVIITVTLSGMSGLLYLSRYRQYRARREAERLREQVQTLEAAKTRFFTNISHEFRTPLTLLLGPIEDALAARYGPVDTRLRRRLQEMSVQARQLHELINQLLDLSKLDAGAMSLQVREHDLAALARRQAELFRSAAEREGITLLVETPAAPLLVWFDAEKMERVISNLMSNALKHTPSNGTVRVRVGARRANGAATVSVRNSGKGLTPDMMATLFDRFASGDQVPGEKTSTGIGLALVKEIVERHGGHVEVASEPGFGVEFIVCLLRGNEHFDPKDRIKPASSTADADGKYQPLTTVVNDEPSATLETETLPPEPPEDAPCILVADDDAPVRRYIQDVLGTDYHVLEAADGEEAWAYIQEHRPALVISDVMMPNLDGFALCRRIRLDEHLAPTPVVFLTARAEEEARIEGWKTGADAYLSKPFSGEEISAIVENVIEVRQLLRTRVRVPDWMEAKAPDVPSPDAEFLDRVQQAVGAHIGDANFGVEWLAGEVGLSARQLQRRLKKLTRLTAAGFIKTMRLERAARLLTQSDLQVQEVARAVGYEDANYFSRLFRQAYGVPPSEYVKEAT